MLAPEVQPQHLPDSWYKNRLQEYTQKASMPLPMYQTFNEGSAHAPQFRSQVWVDGACFTSPNTFSNRKMAEQDAAKHAFVGTKEKVKVEGCSHLLEVIFFCKSIVNEYAVKMNMAQPTYVTNESRALLPVFVSSILLNGVSFTGDAGKNKKEAEQLAARAAVLSILASESGTEMSEIVKSKFKFCDALNKVNLSSIRAGSMAAGVPPLDSAQTSFNTTKEVDVCVGAIKEVDVGVGAIKVVEGSVGSVKVVDASVGAIREADVCVGAINTTKEVDVGATQHSVLSSFPAIQLALSESTSGQSSLTQLKQGSLHVFKKPKTVFASEVVDPPIVFVPSISDQASDNPLACSSSGKKRNRKKKKAKKQVLYQSLSTNVVVPQSQIPTFSMTNQ